MRHYLLQSSKWIAVSTLIVIVDLSLTGCSTTSETFDCKAGQGVGCKSISEVNQMVDHGVDQGAEQGSFGSFSERDTTLSRDKQSKLPLEPAPLSTSMISRDFLSVEPSNSLMVRRMPEEYLRVWVAPFQDHQGNLHEGSVIHTVLKPGYWQLKPLSQSPNGSSGDTATKLNLEENE